MASSLDRIGNIFLNRDIISALPDEVLVNILSKSLQDPKFVRSREMYLNGQLTCKRFRQIFLDKKVRAVLLEQAVSFLYMGDSKIPLSWIKQLPLRENQAVLGEAYEKIVAEAVSSKGQLFDSAIEFLEKLTSEERRLITYLSLTSLPPVPVRFDRDKGCFAYETDRWARKFNRFFDLLPGIVSVTLPRPRELPAGNIVLKRLEQTLTKTITIQYESGGYLSSLPKIPHLNTLIFSHCSQLTTEGLARLLSNCPNITSLRLDNTTLVSLENIQCLETLGLTELALYGENFREEGIIPLFKSKTLKKLSLNTVTCKPASIEKLLNSNLSLHELRLAHLPVQDSHFKQVSETLRDNLIKLELYHCPFVTEEALSLIEKNFPNLQFLDFKYCGKNSEISIHKKL